MKAFRSIKLPAVMDTDKVDATYKKGILKIALPRKKETKPKEIKVKAT